MFGEGHNVSVQVGGEWMQGQRASLAGTEGTLVEAGNFRAFWRTHRRAGEGRPLIAPAYGLPPPR